MVTRHASIRHCSLSYQIHLKVQPFIYDIYLIACSLVHCFDDLGNIGMSDSENTRHLIKKIILITGGNSGIGLEACKILCAEGHCVIATVRSAEKGDFCIR